MILSTTKKITFCFSFFILVSTTLIAQDVWNKVDENFFELNNNALLEKLAQLNGSETLFIEFPNTKGELEAFEIKDHNVLPPALAIKYPSIHAYQGHSIYTENLIVNFTLNSQGLSASLISGIETWDLVNVKGSNNYVLLNTKDLQNFVKSCETIVDDSVSNNLLSFKNFGLNSTNTNAQTLVGDNTLRILRIAVTTTGQYSQYFINKFSLNNSSEETQKAAILGGVVASLNNLNAVFERDLGIRFELIDNNDEIIFLDSNTDPFTEESSSNSYSNIALNEGADVIANVIGLDNIDIGHTLSSITAGLAQVGALCGNFKADGVSGAPVPEGTNFDFTLFAHELGHQLGANHTQNYECNRAADLTAVEPGLGTTIMGYAGTGSFCGVLNEIQTISDDYFHFVSILQIRNHIQSSICGIENEELTNSNPAIEPLPNYTIPANTNFILEASATDADADELLYCWEQIDGEAAEVSPPVSTNVFGPLFRSYSPTTDPKRYFPQKFNTNTEWEVLPGVSRELNFSLTVRDGNPGGIAFTNLTLNVVNTGEQFEITSPTNGLRLPQNSFQQIRWNVAGTDANGINTENVKIEISYNNGETYESLFDSTPNDGSETFTVPNVTLTDEAKIRISAIGNIYYTLTENTFRITEQLDDDLSPLQNPLPQGQKLILQIARLQVPQYTVYIYDMRGGKVYESIRNSASDELDLDQAGIGTGFYIVKIVVGSRIYTEKLLKL